MHVVDALESSLQLARQLGYRVRQEWLGGSGGGGCEIRGQKCLFLDLSLDSGEQLEQVLEALRGDPSVAAIELPDDLRPLLAPQSPSRPRSRGTDSRHAMSESTTSSPGTAAKVLRPFTTDGRQAVKRPA